MSNKVICIIDDDPIYQILVNKSIRMAKTGYESICFKNGREALDYFDADRHENLPEIILLDLEMPIMDGWFFLSEIELLNTEDTAIYIVTSSISDEDMEKAKTFKKVRGYFSKPLNATHILQITNQK